MKKTTCLFLLLMSVALSACQQENDSYYTSARITLTMPAELTIEQIQGTLTLQNLNSMQTLSSAEIHGTAFELEILRGAYKADVEGMIQYSDSEGNSHISHFRAHADYVALADIPSVEVKLPITLLQ